MFFFSASLSNCAISYFSSFVSIIAFLSTGFSFFFPFPFFSSPSSSFGMSFEFRMM